MKLRYNLMLNPAVVRRVDVYADEYDMSRSDAVNRILYEFCNDHDIYDNSSSELDGQVELKDYSED